MPFVISGKSRRLARRPPRGPFVANKDSPQFQNLVAWWPLNRPAPNGHRSHALSPHALTQANGVSVGAGPGGGLAASFTTGSSQYLEHAGTSIITGLPLTTTVWFNVTSTAANNNIWNITDSLGASYFALNAQGAAGGDPLTLFAQQSSIGEVSASTSTSYSANTWHFGAARCSSATDRTVWLDLAGAGTSVTSRNPWNAATVDQVNFGGFHTGASVFGQTNGRIADGRMYDAALDFSLLWLQFDPRTRWDLYYPVRRKVWSFGQTAGGGIIESPAAITATASVVTGTTALANAPAAVAATASAVAPAQALAIALAPLEAVCTVAGASCGLGFVFDPLTGTGTVTTPTTTLANTPAAVTATGSVVTPAGGLAAAQGAEAVTGSVVAGSTGLNQSPAVTGATASIPQCLAASGFVESPTPLSASGSAVLLASTLAAVFEPLTATGTVVTATAAVASITPYLPALGSLARDPGRGAVAVDRGRGSLARDPGRTTTARER